MGLFSSIRSRVLFGTLALAIIPLIIAAFIIGYLSYQSAKDSVQSRVTSQLESLRVVQTAQIKSYFESLGQTLKVTAANPTVVTQFKRFRDIYSTVSSTISATPAEQRAAVREYFTTHFTEEFKRRNAGKDVDMGAVVDGLPEATIALQYLYIARNPNKLGEKNKLDAAEGDSSGFTEVHAQFQPWVRKVIDQYGLYDFFLVDMSGNVVFTYFKEADFASSLVDGPYAGTNIGDAFVEARDEEDTNSVYLADYRPYLPSYDDQAAFMSVPIMEGAEKIGVFIVQVPIEKVNDLMTFRKDWVNSGLGKTGQTLIVGADKLSRNISREMVQDSATYFKELSALKVNQAFIKEMGTRNSDIATQELSSEGINAALADKTGSGTYINHLGKSVLGSYAPIKVLGQSWNILAEIESDEAFQPAQVLLKKIGIAAVSTTLVLSLLGFIFASGLARSINRPIAHLQATVQEVTSGNLDARSKMEGTDELGQLGNAFDNLLDERVSQLVQSAHENEILNNSVIEIMQSLGQLAQNDLTVKIPVTGDVTGAISDAINLVTTETGGALKQVLSISANVARASTQVRQRAAEVMASAEKNGVEVSSASRELEGAATALNQIAAQAQSANQAAERAIAATSQALKIVSETVQGVSLSRDQIRETEKRLKRLGERSQEITTVVNIINQIAERTSVLALNAGMQAAAAGEAGRGFALVADEVKRLAESARDATRQIGTLVNGIQADSGDTIRTMNETITQVVEISKLAERAGEQMEKTLTATDGLVGSVREIASTTASQARASDMLLQRAHNIEQSNKDTLNQLNAQREETGRLMQYSKALVDTVRVFKLPGETPGNGAG
jgi:methyl-accepting chemotaxis protein